MFDSFWDPYLNIVNKKWLLNWKKNVTLCLKNILLGYIVLFKGIEVDKVKIKQFKVWPREVNYAKIHENLSFRFFMHEVGGSEDYIRHEHLLAYNEIIQEFYAHLEPPMENESGSIYKTGNIKCDSDSGYPRRKAVILQ